MNSVVDKTEIEHHTKTIKAIKTTKNCLDMAGRKIHIFPTEKMQSLQNHKSIRKWRQGGLNTDWR